MKKIVVVEDEELIREELSLMLESEGYEVELISNFYNISEQIFKFSPDLILLDINLPNEDGFKICRKVKSSTSIPIVVLTSRDKLKDELYALNIGADEYITKPFRKERLLARINNVLKRYEGRKNLLEGDNFLLDKNTYTLYFDGKSTILSQNQGKLLEAFMQNDEKYLTKEELNLSIWGTSEYIDENALQVNITRLKKTMNQLGMIHKIKAIRNMGYILIKGGESGER